MAVEIMPNAHLHLHQKNALKKYEFCYFDTISWGIVTCTEEYTSRYKETRLGAITFVGDKSLLSIQQLSKLLKKPTYIDIPNVHNKIKMDETSANQESWTIFKQYFLFTEI